LTRLLITNAIYFKGTWDYPFDSTKTHEEKFRISPDKSVSVQMMQKTGKFMYAETESLQIIVMRYTQSSGKLVSMIVLLPKVDNLNVIEDQLNMQKLAELRKKLNYDQVDVYFPKFKVESEYLVHETLAEMGMPIAFTNRADFSGMDGTHNLFISDVMHKAFVEVNERGTEAAASTYISPPSLPHIFKVNHPFIFLIQDSETGNLLFMGRITNPNG
jgi:serpin B